MICQRPPSLWSRVFCSSQRRAPAGEGCPSETFQMLASGSLPSSTLDFCQASWEGCEDLGITSGGQKGAALGSQAVL